MIKHSAMVIQLKQHVPSNTLKQTLPHFQLLAAITSHLILSIDIWSPPVFFESLWNIWHPLLFPARRRNDRDRESFGLYMKGTWDLEHIVIRVSLNTWYWGLSSGADWTQWWCEERLWLVNYLEPCPLIGHKWVWHISVIITWPGSHSADMRSGEERSVTSSLLRVRIFSR